MDPITEAYKKTIAPITERNDYKGMGNVMGDISKKFVAPLYHERNIVVPKKIQSYVEKLLKGKTINVNPTFHKQLNGAKVKSISVNYKPPTSPLLSNINYEIMINTDQGSFEMLHANWESHIEIIG